MTWGVPLLLFIVICCSCLQEGSSKQSVRYRDYVASGGSTVILACDGVAEVYDSVTWRRNDSDTFVAKKDSNITRFNQDYAGRLNFDGKNLILSNSQGSDDGFYYCETKSRGKSSRGSVVWRFIVEEPPRCRAAVSVIHALVDKPAFLPCDVRGKPNPSYEWEKEENGVFVSLGSRFKASTKGLSIHKLSKVDSGKYRVKLVNRVKTVYWSIDLYIHEPTSANIKWQNGRELTNVWLSCGETLKGSNLNNIRWFDPLGTDTMNLKRFKTFVNGSVSIKGIMQTDSGFYKRKESRETGAGIGTTSCLVYLNVQYKPIILSIQPWIQEYEHSNALLPCSAEGNPKPITRWMFANGTTIKNDKKFKYLSNGSLLVLSIRTTDVMNYVCAPYNSIGEAKPKSTKLLIYITPVFKTNGTTILRVKERGEARFNCAANGIPEPDLTFRFLNGTLDESRKVIEPSGLVKLREVRATDYGVYLCTAQSSVGISHRYVQLVIVSAPATPMTFIVGDMDNGVRFSWKPAYGGGLKQYFELWYRVISKPDFDWSIIVTTAKSYELLSKEFDLGESFYFSLRSRNEEGHSDFTYLFKVRKQTGKEASTLFLDSLSSTPLTPYDFSVNISHEGYFLKWKYVETPGRPVAERFVVEYRNKNSTRWREYVRTQRTIRSLTASYTKDTSLYIAASSLPNANHPVEFRVSSVDSTHIRSKPATPIVYKKPGVVTLPIRKGAGRDTSTLLIIVIVAIISLLILIIVGITIYCLRVKSRKEIAEDNDTKTLVKPEKDDIKVDHNSIVLTDSSTFVIPKIEADTPRRYHLRTCPALKLGDCSNSTDRRQPDDVYVLNEPNAQEKVVCTCNKKYVPLRDQQKRMSKTRSFHRSSSLPSVLCTSDADISSGNPSLADEDFDVSDLEKGSSSKLDKDPLKPLKRERFRDSYDKFCRSGSSASQSLPMKTHEIELLTKKLKENEERDAKNPTSDNKPTEKNNNSDQNDNKSIHKESSGFDDDDESSTSDPDSMIELFPGTNKHTKETEVRYSNEANNRDTGYCSDNAPPYSLPSKESIKFNQMKTNKKSHNKAKHLNYYSEDETIAHGVPYRPLKPPSYRQAIIDIERMSEQNEITDSEERCKELIELGRQMGVQLDDSLETDLHNSLPVRGRQSLKYRKPCADTGYSSDIQEINPRRTYTDREKSARCAQLLDEFKNSKSLYDRTIPEEVTSVAPSADSSVYLVSKDAENHIVLQRSGSTSSTDRKSEWLV